MNENSLVVMLSCRCGRTTPFRVLFTGDAGRAAERQLLDERADLRANILKTGHHGSRFSSAPEFIAAVHPQIAVISDGRHNLYHHPAPQTLETLDAAGVRVLRTDRCGAVTIDVSAEVAVRTAIPCITHQR